MFSFSTSTSQSTEINNIDTLYKPCNAISDKKWRRYFTAHVCKIIDDPNLASKIKQLVRNDASEVVEHEILRDSFDPTLGTIKFLRYMIDFNIISDDEAKTIKEENPSNNYEDFLINFIKHYNSH